MPATTSNYVFPLMFFKRLSDVWDEDHRQALDETGDGATRPPRPMTASSCHRRRALEECPHRAARRGPRAALRLPLHRGGQSRTPPGCVRQCELDRQGPDAPTSTLKNLIEHFSKQDLTLAAVPGDELGNGYEYLIKKFADDSGNTAQEFYTNRTLVHLMAQMLEPKPGESIYDPTCGTGGMLISMPGRGEAARGNARTIGLFGQELITITAAIARMNLVIHGVADFHVAGRHACCAGLCAGRPAANLRRGPCQPALLHQEVEPRRVNRTPGDAVLLALHRRSGRITFFQHILASMDEDKDAVLFCSRTASCSATKAEMRRRLLKLTQVE